MHVKVRFREIWLIGLHADLQKKTNSWVGADTAILQQGPITPFLMNRVVINMIHMHFKEKK